VAGPRAARHRPRERRATVAGLTGAGGAVVLRGRDEERDARRAAARGGRGVGGGGRPSRAPSRRSRGGARESQAPHCRAPPSSRLHAGAARRAPRVRAQLRARRDRRRPSRRWDAPKDGSRWPPPDNSSLLRAWRAPGAASAAQSGAGGEETVNRHTCACVALLVLVQRESLPSFPRPRTSAPPPGCSVGLGRARARAAPPPAAFAAAPACPAGQPAQAPAPPPRPAGSSAGVASAAGAAGWLMRSRRRRARQPRAQSPPPPRAAAVPAAAPAASQLGPLLFAGCRPGAAGALRGRRRCDPRRALRAPRQPAGGSARSPSHTHTTTHIEHSSSLHAAPAG
jgi:hypothetical protein